MESDDELIDISVVGESSTAAPQDVLIDVDLLDEANISTGGVTIPDLPEGKDRHLFVSYSTEDADRVWPIVQAVENKFKLTCIYADRDFQAGMDISQNIKDGMQRSWKVLLMLSLNFTRSGWCKYEREFAFVMSMESGLNCIVPVLLEECELPPTLLTITYIDATQPYCDVPAKVALAMSKTDLACYMLPFDRSKKYENGFVVDITAKREPLCYCRPAKYQFILQQADLDAIEAAKIELPKPLLKEAVVLLNQSSTVCMYDCSSSFKKLCCWSLFPFLMLILATVLAVLRFWMQHDTAVIPAIYSAGGALPLLIIATCVCVLCVPLTCQRQKIYMDVHSKMWRRLSQRCLKKNTILLFSGARNKHPTISVMRYNISQCQEYLSCIIKSKTRTTEDENRDYKEEAFELIEEYLDRISPVMGMKYDTLQDAPYNRHNVRKGKACICQCIERTLELQSSPT